MKTSEFENFIKKSIPLSRSMQVEFEFLSESRVLLKVPLKPNINHKLTAFGGSQFAACALACYGLVWSLVKKSNQHSENIVIAESNIRFLKPVPGDFEVEVTLADSNKAIETWEKSGKLKLSLQAEIKFNDQICTTMTGLFVVR